MSLTRPAIAGVLFACFAGYVTKVRGAEAAHLGQSEAKSEVESERHVHRRDARGRGDVPESSRGFGEPSFKFKYPVAQLESTARRQIGSPRPLRLCGNMPFKGETYGHQRRTEE